MDIKYVIQNLLTLEYYWGHHSSDLLNGDIEIATKFNSEDEAGAVMFSLDFQDIVHDYSNDNDFIAFEIKKIYIPKD